MGGRRTSPEKNIRIINLGVFLLALSIAVWLLRNYLELDCEPFMWAFVQDWVSRMSGIASVALLIVGFVKKWKTTPRAAIMCAALACFLLASVRIWTQEHRARLRAEHTVEQLTIPVLSGSIQWISVAPAQNGKSCLLTMGVVIRNSGAPTITDDFLVKAKLTDGRQFLLRFIPTPKVSLTLSGNKMGASVDLPMGDYLPRKNSEKPIPTGGGETGWLFVLGEDIGKDDMIKRGVLITLSFADITGKRWELSREMTGQETHFPDLRKLQHP